MVVNTGDYNTVRPHLLGVQGLYPRGDVPTPDEWYHGVQGPGIGLSSPLHIITRKVTTRTCQPEQSCQSEGIISCTCVVCN